ncbi:MAG: hypothetical protein ABIB71_09525 [Candidatus Woesearchaeota archaeon]
MANKIQEGIPDKDTLIRQIWSRLNKHASWIMLFFVLAFLIMITVHENAHLTMIRLLGHEGRFLYRFGLFPDAVKCVDCIGNSHLALIALAPYLVDMLLILPSIFFRHWAFKMLSWLGFADIAVNILGIFLPPVLGRRENDFYILAQIGYGWTATVVIVVGFVLWLIGNWKFVEKHLFFLRPNWFGK